MSPPCTSTRRMRCCRRRARRRSRRKKRTHHWFNCGGQNRGGTWKGCQFMWRFLWPERATGITKSPMCKFHFTRKVCLMLKLSLLGLAAVLVLFGATAAAPAGEKDKTPAVLNFKMEGLDGKTVDL